jgi:hypothetical protein
MNSTVIYLNTFQPVNYRIGCMNLVLVYMWVKLCVGYVVMFYSPILNTPYSTYSEMKQVAVQQWNIWHSKTVWDSCRDVNLWCQHSFLTDMVPSANTWRQSWLMWNITLICGIWKRVSGVPRKWIDGVQISWAKWTD